MHILEWMYARQYLWVRLAINVGGKFVIPGSKAKLNAHSMCAQESSLHTYHIENGYRITNVTV
jgi:hypothetical protein